MANPQFKIVKGTDYIDIYVPITSQGKFRCKTRRNFKANKSNSNSYAKVYHSIVP